MTSRGEFVKLVLLRTQLNFFIIFVFIQFRKQKAFTIYAY